MGHTVRILLADDHTIVLQALARLLGGKPDLKVVGTATNGLMTVEKALELEPDIIIMDIAMPIMNGIEAAKRIRKDLPNAKILILSMYSDEHYIHGLIEIGISGYLLKNSSGRDLIKAIQAAMKGETFLSPSISEKFENTYFSPRKILSGEERFKQLSNREKEIFQLIAEGHPIRDIANTLRISVSTVKSHKSKIMEKLGVSHPVHLVHFAIQIGLIDPDL